MTLLISCILLWQFEWPWYWYPITVVIWGFHEYHFYSSFKRLRTHFERLQRQIHTGNPNAF
jgi:hypothetical protein